MDRTENYQLPKWEKSDRVMMEDFNDMTGKIDEGMAELAQTVAKCGNCRIVWGSYTGDGSGGESNPKRLTFSGKPLFLMVVPTASSNTPYRHLLAVQGMKSTYGASDLPRSGVTFAWSGNSVSWYALGYDWQFTEKDQVYYYVALIAVDGEA